MTHIHLLAACALLSAAGTAGPLDAQPGRGVSLELTEIRETRIGAVRAQQDSFPLEREGLKLSFAIELPRGQKLVELQEPTSIQAVDATGVDLTDVEPGFTGEPDYIDVIYEWEGDAKRATLTLGTPSRAASTFSVQAQMLAVVCSGSTPVSAQATGSARPLDTGVAGFPEASIRARSNGSGTQVTITPGAARTWIEEIALVSGGVECDSGSSMWNDGGVTYYFDAPAPASAAVRLTVRRELRTLPVTVDIARVALP